MSVCAFPAERRRDSPPVERRSRAAPCRPIGPGGPYTRSMDDGAPVWQAWRMVRHARPDDAARCAAIYLPHVRDGVASLEDRPPGPDEMALRMAEVSATHPWLVAERDGEVAGYAYATRHHVRPGYRWATDVSVYVDSEHRRAGVGRNLYARSVRASPRAGAVRGLRRDHAAERGERGAPRGARLPTGGRLPRGELEVRPLARRGLVAAAAAPAHRWSPAGAGPPASDWRPVMEPRPVQCQQR